MTAPRKLYIVGWRDNYDMWHACVVECYDIAVSCVGAFEALDLAVEWKGVLRCNNDSQYRIRSFLELPHDSTP